MIFWKFCQIENVTNISNTTEKCNFNFKIFDSEAVEISEPKFPAKNFNSSEIILWQFCQIENVANISNTKQKWNFNFQIFDSKAAEISEPKFPGKKNLILRKWFSDNFVK